MEKKCSIEFCVRSPIIRGRQMDTIGGYGQGFHDVDIITVVKVFRSKSHYTIVRSSDENDEASARRLSAYDFAPFHARLERERKLSRHGLVDIGCRSLFAGLANYLNCKFVTSRMKHRPVTGALGSLDSKNYTCEMSSTLTFAKEKCHFVMSLCD